MNAASRIEYPSEIEQLYAAVDAVRARAAVCSEAEATAAVTAALRAVDLLVASAVEIIARTTLGRGRGLSQEMALTLDARRTRSEARFLCEAASVLVSLPATAAAFSSGVASWGEIRGTVVELRGIRSADRAGLDTDLAEALSAHADPDAALGAVADLIDGLRQRSVARREERALERGYLAVQAGLDGYGTIHGEADAESLAAVVAALDAVAARPVNADAPGAPSRASQRMDALVHLCEQTLSGRGAPALRPRPRLVAALDAREGTNAGARVLWGLPGRVPRLSLVGTEVLACEADLIQVFFDRATPVGVKALRGPSERTRNALVARDQGCRFPGCGAPWSWADGHHIAGRGWPRAERMGNLVLLCRRCHRRVHRYGWKIAIARDGTIEFSHRGRRYRSPPPVPPPRT